MLNTIYPIDTFKNSLCTTSLYMAAVGRLVFKVPVCVCVYTDEKTLVKETYTHSDLTTGATVYATSERREQLVTSCKVSSHCLLTWFAHKDSNQSNMAVQPK